MGQQSSVLSEYSWINSDKHGIKYPENSQNITEILAQKFMYDNLKNNPYKNRMKEKAKVPKTLPKFPTKASKLRDDYLKNYICSRDATKEEQPKVEWKLRQFLGIGPHEDIAESLRRAKRLCK